MMAYEADMFMLMLDVAFTPFEARCCRRHRCPCAMRRRDHDTRARHELLPYAEFRRDATRL